MLTTLNSFVKQTKMSCKISCLTSKWRNLIISKDSKKLWKTGIKVQQVRFDFGFYCQVYSKYRYIVFILRFSYRRCNVYVMYVLYLFDCLERSTATNPPPGSCQEKCIVDWTEKGTPDCIKRDACQRACNDGTCPEYNRWIYDKSRTSQIIH